MYRINDVLIDGKRISNVFNTQDETLHAKLARPIGGFWALSKILEMELLMDETIQAFTNKLGTAFADATSGTSASICMMDDWLTYCMTPILCHVIKTRGREEKMKIKNK